MYESSVDVVEGMLTNVFGVVFALSLICNTYLDDSENDHLV